MDREDKMMLFALGEEYFLSPTRKLIDNTSMFFLTITSLPNIVVPLCFIVRYIQKKGICDSADVGSKVIEAMESGVIRGCLVLSPRRKNQQ